MVWVPESSPREINEALASANARTDATILARRNGAKVYGIREGFRWLMAGDTSHATPLEIADVSRIRPLGGSILLTARTNPTKRAEDLDRVMKDFGYPVGPLALVDEVGIDVGAKVVRPIAMDTPITTADVEIKPSTVASLRQLQDQWSRGTIAESELLTAIDQLATD